MADAKPKLRKREILAALAAGGIAAGGIAIAIDEGDDIEPREERRAGIEEAPDSETEITYELANFDEVSTAGPQDIIITYGEEFSVRAEGSSRSLEQLEAVLSHSRLMIRPKNGGFRGDWASLGGVTYYITVPALNRLSTQGTGNIEVDRIEGESFEGIIGGAGEMTIETLTVDEAKFRIEGAGSLELAGTAGMVDITIGGAGNVDAEDLQTRTARINLTGLGEIDLTVTEEADISMTGAGEIDIYGPATCSISQTGFGSISCEGPDNDGEEG